MVGGSAERDWQLEPIESGQQPIEQRAIFHGELPGEKIVQRVVEPEPRLHCGEVGRTEAEGIERLAELAGLRPVLGIVDCDISPRASGSV